MDGSRLKTKAHIEAARPFVLRLDKDRTNAGDVGGLKRTQDGIPQQPPANLFPLMTKIHGQSGQNHHRNGMPRQTLPNALGRGIVIHRPNGQAVIADYPPPLTNHKGLCCIGPLILPGIALQPVVQYGMTAIEIRTVMRFGQQNRSGARGGGWSCILTFPGARSLGYSLFPGPFSQIAGSARSV